MLLSKRGCFSPPGRNHLPSAFTRKSPSVKQLTMTNDCTFTGLWNSGFFAICPLLYASSLSVSFYFSHDIPRDLLTNQPPRCQIPHTNAGKEKIISYSTENKFYKTQWAKERLLLEEDGWEGGRDVLEPTGTDSRKADYVRLFPTKCSVKSY